MTSRRILHATNESPQNGPLQRLADVLPHLPNAHLSATVSYSPEGPVGDGNGRSASAKRPKGRLAVQEDPAASRNHHSPSGQTTPAGAPRLEENQRLLTAREVADLLAVPESWVREATRAG